PYGFWRRVVQQQGARMRPAQQQRPVLLVVVQEFDGGQTVPESQRRGLVAGLIVRERHLQHDGGAIGACARSGPGGGAHPERFRQVQPPALLGPLHQLRQALQPGGTSGRGTHTPGERMRDRQIQVSAPREAHQRIKSGQGSSCRTAALEARSQRLPHGCPPWNSGVVTTGRRSSIGIAILELRDSWSGCSCRVSDLKGNLSRNNTNYRRWTPPDPLPGRSSGLRCPHNPPTPRLASETSTNESREADSASCPDATIETQGNNANRSVTASFFHGGTLD